MHCRKTLCLLIFIMHLGVYERCFTYCQAFILHCLWTKKLNLDMTKITVLFVILIVVSQTTLRLLRLLGRSEWRSFETGSWRSIHMIGQQIKYDSFSGVRRASVSKLFKALGAALMSPDWVQMHQVAPVQLCPPKVRCYTLNLSRKLPHRHDNKPQNNEVGLLTVANRNCYVF